MYSQYMRRALELAAIGLAEGEVPVGAVMVKDGEIIAEAHNRCEQDKDPTAHAELLAIRQAAETLADWRLTDCTLIVTLEPCCMCAGAIVNARVGKVVFGASDPELGCLGSRGDVYAIGYNGEITGGVMADQCSSLLKKCFNRKNMDQSLGFSQETTRK